MLKQDVSSPSFVSQTEVAYVCISFVHQTICISSLCYAMFKKPETTSCLMPYRQQTSQEKDVVKMTTELLKYEAAQMLMMRKEEVRAGSREAVPAVTSRCRGHPHVAGPTAMGRFLLGFRDRAADAQYAESLEERFPIGLKKPRCS